MNNDANTQDLLQRFAVSGLSRERKDEAVNEEILIGKYTGEFFIKTKDGVVLSTDVLNRLKSSTDNAIRLAELSGITGDLYKIDFNELVLPNHIDYSVNILENEPIALPITTTKFLLNLDLDEYDIIDDTAKPINSNAQVKVAVEVSIGSGESVTLEIIQSIQNINYYPIEIPFENVGDIMLTGISISRDQEIFNKNATDRTILLHNMFIAINN